MGKIVSGGTRTIVNPTIVQKVEAGGQITLNINLTVRIEDDGKISVSTEDDSNKENPDILIPEIESLGMLNFGDEVI